MIHSHAHHRSTGPFRMAALLVCCMASLLSSSSGQAQPEEDLSIPVKVRVETKPAPTKAIGLVLSTDGAEQVSATTIQKVGDKLYDVIFSVPRSSLKQDSVATAMAISAGGDITFANVTPALLSETQMQLADIPECPSEDTSSLAKVNQLAPLKALVDIRADRADLAQRKVMRALDEETLNKIRKLEEAFGLAHGEPLSVTVPAEELVDRLARINFALKRYQAFKNQSASGGQSSKQSGT